MCEFHLNPPLVLERENAEIEFWKAPESVEVDLIIYALEAYQHTKKFFQPVFYKESKLPQRYTHGSMTGIAFSKDKAFLLHKYIKPSGELYSNILVELRNSNTSLVKSPWLKISVNEEKVKATFFHKATEKTLVSPEYALSHIRVKASSGISLYKEHVDTILPFTSTVKFFLIFPKSLNITGVDFKEGVLKAPEVLLEHLRM